MCDKPLCMICHEKPVLCRERCVRCLRYLQRHGIERPARPTWHKGQYERCINCGDPKLAANGRCKACKCYFERNNKERPRELWERRKAEAQMPRWCQNCGSPNIMGHMRCTACYRYWKAHGKERPYRYFADNAKCKNCGIPLDTVVIVKKGHCSKCYEYKRMYKKERPQKLWGNGPHGFCECGQPANHLIDKFPLCDGCAVEYQKGAYS